MKITINPKNTLANLTKGFDWKYVTSYLTELPKAKQETLNVEYLSFKKYITNREVMEEVAKKGLRLATIREGLEFAQQHPDEQRTHSIVTLETIGEQLCYLYLGESDGQRKLHVGKYDLDRNWHEEVVFLVVAASPLPLEPLGFDLGLLELSYNGVTYKLTKKQ